MSCFRRGSTARAAGMRLPVEFQRLGRQRNILPRDLIETALAHVVGDAAEQAYRRSDALEKRRKLMETWASYCEPKANSNVLHLRKS